MILNWKNMKHMKMFLVKHGIGGERVIIRRGEVVSIGSGNVSETNDRFLCPLKLLNLNCKQREHPSQSYGTPKKRNKILNISHRTILYETFFYYFSILNLFQT